MTPAGSSVTALALLASLVLAGCGASADPESEEVGVEEEGAGGSGNVVEEPGGIPSEPCDLSTAFDGDENCIAPPHPSEGVQLHIGPSSYDDPDVINATDEEGNYLWIMPPGAESTACYHAVMQNEQPFHYFKTQYRMRAGSHHMILRQSESVDGPEGWGNCSSSIIGAFGGTQHVEEDFPPNGIVAPEDEGLGHRLGARNPVDAQLHFYNTTDEPRLREIWVNFHFKPDDEVTTNLGMLGAFTRLTIPPQTTATVEGSCKAEQALGAGTSPRIVALFGHAHTHNKRFHVVHHKADGSTETIYDSYDGAEAPTYTYNTLVQNPVPDPVGRISGGRSGLLVLEPGEQIKFACDIVNDTDVTFYGRNEVNDDEMCHLFGSVAGAGFPCFTIGG